MLVKNGILRNINGVNPSTVLINFVCNNMCINKEIHTKDPLTFRFSTVYTDSDGKPTTIVLLKNSTVGSPIDKPVRISTLSCDEETEVFRYNTLQYNNIDEAIADGKYNEEQLIRFDYLMKLIKETFDE